MLKIVEKLGQLDFRHLMDVYVEGNRKNGGERYPHLSESQQIMEAEQDFYQYLRECFFATKRAVYAIWIVDGIYVSALRLEPYQDGLLLEALETAPSHRKKGYAKALIQAVLNFVGEENIYSHIHKQNVPSIRTHESCGFHRILEHALYVDGSVNSNACTFCSKV